MKAKENYMEQVHSDQQMVLGIVKWGSPFRSDGSRNGQAGIRWPKDTKN
jgi:hypothetical protein